MWQHIDFDYNGVQVFVTGGANGIGLGVASAYREAGADVTITGRRAGVGDYDHDLSGFRYLQLEVEDDASIAAVAGAIGELDILINNAGASLIPAGLDEYQPALFERAVRINLTSGYRMLFACHDKLAASRFPAGASVISMASLTSLFGNDITPAYGAAKAGLTQLTKTLAIAWAKDNIRVNAIIAGLIASNMTAPMLGDEQMTAPMIERTPMRRIGQPLDVAGPVLFLTSPAAGYITGQSLPVDGGYSIQG